MQFDQTIENHFPITVMTRCHKDVAELNDSIVSLIKELERRFANTSQNAALDPQITTQGGFQTTGARSFLEGDNPAVQHLRRELLEPAVDTYLEAAHQAKPGTVRYRLYGWANILRTGDWQSPHIHPTEFNVASGVYYVRVTNRPPPEGCIEFINPHLISVQHGQTANRIYQPREGDLILFPPYYMHFAHPFRGSAERAIVSFDVRVEPPDSNVQFVF